jgi:hypothetical protein
MKCLKRMGSIKTTKAAGLLLELAWIGLVTRSIRFMLEVLLTFGEQTNVVLLTVGVMFGLLTLYALMRP